MSKLSLLTACFRPLPLGIRPQMSLSEKKKIYITNTAAFWLLVLGPLFAALNAWGGRGSLALVNLATSTLGAACLLLAWRRKHQTAALLLLTGANIAFFFSGLLFHNGMEYTLLVCMLGALFMCERPALRIPFALTSAVGFLAVNWLQYEKLSPFPPLRHATNLFIFLCCYYWIIETFRRITDNYHREIESHNRHLAESRRRLKDDHIALTRLTEELQAANVAKEKLFSIVAHDLRSPVGNLRSIVELLEDASLSREEFQQTLTTLKADLDQTHSCLETLLTWSASQLNILQPHFAAIELNSIIAECIALLHDLAARKELTLDCSIPAGAYVRADANQLAAILRNLLSNAIKFTPRGGNISLTAVEVEANAWCIRIIDSGVGIAPEHLEKIRNPSSTYTTPGTGNERGLGLGLQICQDFIKAHGSALEIESAPGCGATFQFTLQRAESYS